MYVIVEAQFAVQLNPGSNVMYPVLARRCLISRSLLLKVPVRTGN